MSRFKRYQADMKRARKKARARGLVFKRYRGKSRWFNECPAVYALYKPGGNRVTRPFTLSEFLDA